MPFNDFKWQPSSTKSMVLIPLGDMISLTFYSAAATAAAFNLGSSLLFLSCHLCHHHLHATRFCFDFELSWWKIDFSSTGSLMPWFV
jgi:hypothetical protein